jgi:hypothetical protein
MLASRAKIIYNIGLIKYFQSVALNFRILPLLLLLISGWMAVGVSTSQSATISWWRFEAGSDTDPSPGGLVNANEVSGQPAMISSNAIITTDAPSLFAPFIPQTGDTNTGSVRAFVNGSAEDGIFGSAAYSSTLDVNSITVEFWVRTTENEAGFVARTTNPQQAGETGSIDNGFRIVEPQNLRVEYYRLNGAGTGGTLVTLTSGIAVNDNVWHYIAFRYDQATGLGELLLDGVVVASNDGPDNRRLWWGPSGSQPTVIAGYRLDGNPNNTFGTLDEIRFSDVALPNTELLLVPEASTVWTFGILGLLFAAGSFRRFFQRPAPQD